jgi:hypothetical protein
LITLIALGNKYLYVTTNIIDRINKVSKPIILRISLEDLRNRNNAEYSYYQDQNISMKDESFTPVQGAKDRMYWAAHLSNNQMRIYQWNESLPSTNVEYSDVHIPAWTRLGEGGGDCRGYHGNWCGRADDTITSGWTTTAGVLGFFWNADKQQIPQDNLQFKHPYIDSAIFNVTSGNIENITYIGRPYIWSPDFAWLYGYSSPNNDGDVGIAAFYGGGDKLEKVNMAVGVGDSINGLPPTSWKMDTALNGTDIPYENEWGDYIRVRNDNSDLSSNWISSGYSLEGGNTSEFVEPHYIVFGLANNSLLQSTGTNNTRPIDNGFVELKMNNDSVVLLNNIVQPEMLQYH